MVLTWPTRRPLHPVMDEDTEARGTSCLTHPGSSRPRRGLSSLSLGKLRHREGCNVSPGHPGIGGLAGAGPQGPFLPRGDPTAEDNVELVATLLRR